MIKDLNLSMRLKEPITRALLILDVSFILVMILLGFVAPMSLIVYTVLAHFIG